MEITRFETWDIVALVFYFVAVFAAGLISMCRSNRGTVSGYFLAGRFMVWFPVGASLFASNIGSEHFVGLAGSGAAKGISVGAFEFNACLLLQLLGWVFLPVYIASGVCTLPEYMMKRFGGSRIQIYLAVLSLILYVFTKISVNLYSGSLFIREALGWNEWYAILLLLALTAVVTVTGGLAAVIYTDTLQCVVMLTGAVILTVISFVKVGGFSGLLTKYGKAIARVNTSSANAELMLNSTSAQCYLPSREAFVLLRGVTDNDMPWLGFLLGQTPASIWYWCADQMMVQRTLSAKSLSHAQGATLMAGYIKLLPMFIMVMPGMISRILYPDEVACATPADCLRVCGQRSGCTNMAYPKLVMGVMPTGLRGLMLAVMLAALMSDLTSIFNSASTLFTVDIYRRMRRLASNKELMIVGRLFVLVMVVVSIVWIPVIQEMQGGQLFIYIQAISAYLAPPIASVYLVAILWTRGNELGAFSGLMYGLVVGAIRMVLDFVYREPVCGDPDTRPWIISRIHYMYFALFSFVTTILIMVTVSMVTKRPELSRLNKLTFWTIRRKGVDQEHPESTDSETKEHVEETAPPVEMEVQNGGGTGDCKMAVVGAETACLSQNGLPATAEDGKMDNPDLQVTYVQRVSSPHAPIANTTNRRHQDSRWRYWLRRGWAWFCGLEEILLTDRQERTTTLREMEAEQRRYMRKITSLRQNPTARIFLFVNLVLIGVVTVFCYVFFSLYFGEIEVGPIPILELWNSSSGVSPTVG